jgi:calpain-7
LTWKGAWSDHDPRWTPELQRRLSYDVQTQKAVDNGIFWIEWTDLQRYFPNIHLSWNPALFRQKYTLHGAQLLASERLVELDRRSMRDATQVQVKIDSGTDSSGAPASVWMLLTRHVLGLRSLASDAEDDSQFIALHVFDRDTAKAKANTSSDGKIRGSLKPIEKGVYSNSPHALMRVDVPKAGANLVVAVSQLRPTPPNQRKMTWTLSLYSTVPFQTHRTQGRWPHEQRMTGKWTLARSGGCPNHPTFFDNPTFTLVTPRLASGTGVDSVRVMVELSARCEYPVGVNILSADQRTLVRTPLPHSSSLCLFLSHRCDLPRLNRATTFRDTAGLSFLQKQRRSCVFSLPRSSPGSSASLR